jgi:TRAP-type C4-dicarboxylate transport system permease large subunit
LQLHQHSNALLGISNNPVVILLIINVILLLVGTFMDITPAILIFTPIFLPICTSFGMSPIQFGIMMTFNLCIGTIMPPVGNILFVGVKVAKTTIENVMMKLISLYLLLLTYSNC